MGEETSSGGTLLHERTQVSCGDSLEVHFQLYFNVFLKYIYFLKILN
jgi:hypothetical protein